jgi:hypothetical protein
LTAASQKVLFGEIRWRFATKRTGARTSKIADQTTSDHNDRYWPMAEATVADWRGRLLGCCGNGGP